MGQKESPAGFINGPMDLIRSLQRALLTFGFFPKAPAHNQVRISERCKVAERIFKFVPGKVCSPPTTPHTAKTTPYKIQIDARQAYLTIRWQVAANGFYHTRLNSQLQ